MLTCMGVMHTLLGELSMLNSGAVVAASMLVLGGAYGAEGQGGPTYAHGGYYVPKSVIQLSGAITYTQSIESFDPNNSDQPNPQFCAPVVTSRNVQVTLTSVADSSAFVEVDPSATFFKDVEYTLQVNERGLLTGFSGESKGRAGDFIASVGAIIGRVIPFFTGAPIPKRDQKFKSFDFDTSDKFCGNPIGLQKALDSFYSQANALANDKFEAASTSLTTERTKLTDARFKLLGEATKLSGEAAGEVLKAAVASFDRQIAEIDARIAAIQAKAAAAKKAFFAARKLVAKTHTVPVNLTVDPDDLPDNFAHGGSWASLKTGVDDARARAFFEAAGVAVGVVPATDKNPAARIMDADDSNARNRQRGRTSKALLRFRNATPATIQLFSLTGSTGAQILKLEKASLQNVLFGHTTPSVALFDSKAFAKRELSVELHANGALAKIARKSESSGANIASAIDAALKGGLGAAQETVDSLAAIEKAQIGRGQAAVQAEIDALKLEKDQLEAEIARDGVLASDALVRETALIDAQISALNSGNSLAGAQLEAMRLQAEIAQFGTEAPPSEAEQLSQQIALVKLQQELATLQAPATAPTIGETLNTRLAELQTRLQILQVLRDIEAIQGN